MRAAVIAVAAGLMVLSIPAIAQNQNTSGTQAKKWPVRPGFESAEVCCNRVGGRYDPGDNLCYGLRAQAGPVQAYQKCTGRGG